MFQPTRSPEAPELDGVAILYEQDGGEEAVEREVENNTAPDEEEDGIELVAEVKKSSPQKRRAAKAPASSPTKSVSPSESGRSKRNKKTETVVQAEVEPKSRSTRATRIKEPIAEIMPSTRSRSTRSRSAMPAEVGEELPETSSRPSRSSRSTHVAVTLTQADAPSKPTRGRAKKVEPLSESSLDIIEVDVEPLTSRKAPAATTDRPSAASRSSRATKVKIDKENAPEVAASPVKRAGLRQQAEETAPIGRATRSRK
jgi:hypothetical protein